MVYLLSDISSKICRKVVENVPRGVHVNFLKAERSLHRWALEDLQRIHAAEAAASDEAGGVEMHVLEDAGHWVSVQIEHTNTRHLLYINTNSAHLYSCHHHHLRLSRSQNRVKLWSKCLHYKLDSLSNL